MKDSRSPTCRPIPHTRGRNRSWRIFLIAPSVIDTFIGEPAKPGLGHGSAFLRVITEMLIAEGATLVTIDPHRDNHHARRAYTRAGFIGEEIVETESGPAVVILFSRV